MDRFFRAIAQLVTVMTISLGVRPPVVALLELLQRPSVRIVMITRRRAPEYTSLFMLEAESQRSDRDSAHQSAAEERSVESSPTAIHRAGTRTYTRVRSA